MAALAALVSTAVKLLLFPHLSGNADEGVYLLQAEALLEGRLTYPVSSHNTFFQPWLTGEHDGHYFTKYLPGYPAVLAVSTLLFGTPIVALALTAGAWVLSVYALAYEVLRSRRIALLSAAFLLLSPIFLVHSALFLSYPLITAVVCAGSVCLLRAVGAPTDRAARWWALGGGALFGFGLLVRQYDVVLVAVPVAVHLLLCGGRRVRALARAAGWAALGALPPVAVILAYDTAVTGTPLRLPLPATDPLDTIGFGLRRILPTEPSLEWTADLAITVLGQQLLMSPSWVFGAGALPVIAAVGLVARRPALRQRLLLAALVVAFPTAYFPFWGAFLLVGGEVGSAAGEAQLEPVEIGLNGLGPHYYIPAFSVLMILAGAGADAVGRWARRRLPLPGVALVAAAVPAVAATAYSLQFKVDTQQYVNQRAEAVLAAIPPTEQLTTPAVIVVAVPETSRYVGVPYPFLRNDPELANEVLYAVSRGPADVDLAARYPGRALYGLRLPALLRGGEMAVPPGSFVPLSTATGSPLRLRTTVHAPAGDGCLAAFLALGDEVRLRPLGCDVPPGRTWTLDWTIGGADAGTTAGAGSTAPIAVPPVGENSTLVIGVAAGTTPTAAADFTAPTTSVWEQRISLGVTGTAADPEVLVQLPGWGWRRSVADRRWSAMPVHDTVDTAEAAAG